MPFQILLISIFQKTVPAHFKTNTFSAETIRKGDNVKIKCECFGEMPLSISWTKDRIPFQPSKEPRYNLIEQTTGLTSSSNLDSSTQTNDDQQQSSKNEITSSTSISRLNSLNRLNALQDLKHTNSFINILEINQTNRKDSALFSCIASNRYGKDEYNVQIILQGKPNFV